MRQPAPACKAQIPRQSRDGSRPHLYASAWKIPGSRLEKSLFATVFKPFSSFGAAGSLKNRVFCRPAPKTRRFWSPRAIFRVFRLFRRFFTTDDADGDSGASFPACFSLVFVFSANFVVFASYRSIFAVPRPLRLVFVVFRRFMPPARRFSAPKSHFVVPQRPKTPVRAIFKRSFPLVKPGPQRSHIADACGGANHRFRTPSRRFPLPHILPCRSLLRH